MFQSITFYVGEKTLGIYGEEFPLGALTTEVLKKIIKKEEPDSILPTLGGQAGLNLAMEIAETDFVAPVLSCYVELIVDRFLERFNIDPYLFEDAFIPC